MKTHRLPLNLARLSCAVGLLILITATAAAQNFVPGSGKRVADAGDDFEDPAWLYNVNPPKSSNSIDKQSRLPAGSSVNGRWFEPEMRGAPDVIRRVDTPAGGIPGSKGAMLMKTLFSGVPDRPSRTVQQDDFIAQARSGSISVSQSPSVVVRVFLPPYEQWEKRTGNSFGLRASALTTIRKPRGRFGSSMTSETYWPGIFIWFDSKADSQNKTDSAKFILRGDESGRDLPGPAVTQTGWWTLGMSFSPDGQVHYYIKPGVENLTAKDHVATHSPYSYRCEQFQTFFFDILNLDDGKSWSTDWIVDDPAVYVGR